MSLMSLVMSSGNSSALKSGVKGLLQNTKMMSAHLQTHTHTHTHGSHLMPEGWVGRHKMEGIPRLPWGCAGGMGFWGRLGALLFPFFLCFLVSAGGLDFFRGLCRWICWWRWYVLRLISPRRKLSCKVPLAHTWLNDLIVVLSND